MSARYLPVQNPRSSPDAQQELDDAFESDGEDESTPLAHLNPPRSPTNPGHSHEPTSAIPGAYDFERDYDYPPPGSPPRPSATALPNDYGNSNGQLPTSPIQASMPRPSIFRKAFGAILPTHYARVPTEAQSSRTRGGGVENDGVFANVMAKPQRARVVRTADGDVHMVPEDNQKEAPPSYSDAQADAVPPYWETTVHAPGLEPGADMIIDDLPSGSIGIFCINLFTSFFFQFVGFLLTYLLHTSHAAKFGSRAGLGLTMIQYGFYSRGTDFAGDNVSGDAPSGSWPIVPNQPGDPDLSPDVMPTNPEDVRVIAGVTSRDWLSFLFMTLGWFLFLSSVVGYWRVKRWENSVRAASSAAPVTREAIERDIAVRRNLAHVFGFAPDEEEDERIRREESGSVIVIPTPEALEETRLTRDLRAAGLL